jgi:hypothetical protein
MPMLPVLKALLDDHHAGPAALCALLHMLLRMTPADITYRWQKPLMSLALYIMSAATSMRRIRYMSVYMSSSSFRLVSTVELGPSIL